MATAPVFETQARNGDKIRNASAIINCTDVLATLLWYQDKLGLQVEFAWGEPVIHGSIIAGDTTFHFSRSDPTSPRTCYMTIYVNELDDLFDDIVGAGRRGRAAAGDDGVGDARVHDQRLQRRSRDVRRPVERRVSDT